MREINYKDNPDFKKEIKSLEAVIIVDFSFNPTKMQQLFDRAYNITWIDHHRTAKEYKYYDKKLQNMENEWDEVNLPGLRDFSKPGKSGCELTWEFLFPNKPMPEAVRLIGDYDAWRFDTEKDTKLFQMGIKLLHTGPKGPHWHALLKDGNFSLGLIQSIKEDGQTITKYRDMFCLDYRKAYGWELEFEGHKCYAMNVYNFGSLGFGKLFDKYDICISMVLQDKRWTVGLYSKTVDVGEIAKRNGGGGHKSAAGFVCEKLPF
ncbi:MAG: hypothetical protein KAJ10_05370 [Thermodesulfovibrionia bacterium]|nr:hypothetical protein [Thermodesulfovibrionia bacterium]